MKNIMKYVLLFATAFLTTGCHMYISADLTEGPNKTHTYYGAYNRRDNTHADVVLYEKDTNLVCDGVIHIKAPSRAITMKNDKVPAFMKLACADGRLMDVNWELSKATFSDGTAQGKDQYNNIYNFKTISKKEYKENYPNKAKVPSKNFILKY